MIIARKKFSSNNRALKRRIIFDCYTRKASCSKIRLPRVLMFCGIALKKLKLVEGREYDRRQGGCVAEWFGSFIKRPFGFWVDLVSLTKDSLLPLVRCYFLFGDLFCMWMAQNYGSQYITHCQFFVQSLYNLSICYVRLLNV